MILVGLMETVDELTPKTLSTAMQRLALELPGLLNTHGINVEYVDIDIRIAEQKSGKYNIIMEVVSNE